MSSREGEGWFYREDLIEIVRKQSAMLSSGFDKDNPKPIKELVKELLLEQNMTTVR